MWVCRARGSHNGGLHSSRNGARLFRGGDMCVVPSLWLESNKLQNGDLSTNRQGRTTGASRRTRIPGRHACSPDGLTRGSAGNGASASGTAKDASRGGGPDARRLRRLTFVGSHDYTKSRRWCRRLLKFACARRGVVPSANSIHLGKT